MVIKRPGPMYLGIAFLETLEHSGYPAVSQTRAPIPAELTSCVHLGTSPTTLNHSVSARKREPFYLPHRTALSMNWNNKLVAVTQ